MARSTYYDEAKVKEIVDLSNSTIIRALRNTKLALSTRVGIAEKFALKAMPQQVEIGQTLRQIVLICGETTETIGKKAVGQDPSKNAVSGVAGLFLADNSPQNGQ